MADYIDREGTIEVLNHLKPFCHGAAQERMLRRIIREVGFIPAADVVEVVRGRWIGVDGETVGMVNGVPWSDCCCSVCGDYLTGSSEYPAKGNYCPNCGADMRGADNG